MHAVTQKDKERGCLVNQENTVRGYYFDEL